MTLHKRYFLLWIFTAMAYLTMSAAQADRPRPDDAAALQGVDSAKAVFDITTENPNKLSFYLKLIGETAETMKAAGVEPDFVLTFRGPATFYVSSDRERIKIEDSLVADSIQAQLDTLSRKSHMKLEQCSVAARALKVDIATVYPSVKVVGNSWISLIGYQNKGYALVPVR